MKNPMIFAACAVSALTLSACGGSGGGSFGAGQTQAERLFERTQDYQALLDRTSRIFPSGSDAMDNAPGSASFEGGAAIAVNPVIFLGELQGGDAVLIGDANVNVNFRTETVSGSVTNVFGVDNIDRLDEYSGTIRLSGGNIDGNDLSADYSGTLRGNGDTITVGGEMNGEFLGNPNIRALEIGGNGTGRLNGSTSQVVIGIVAER